jgi:hypothetical protein
MVCCGEVVERACANDVQTAKSRGGPSLTPCEDEFRDTPKVNFRFGRVEIFAVTIAL